MTRREHTDGGGQIPQSILDALGSPLSVGPTERHRAGKRRRARQQNGEIRVTRQPVEAWSCDEGDATGTGWQTMQQHAASTNHRSYRKVDT